MTRARLEARGEPQPADVPACPLRPISPIRLYRPRIHAHILFRITLVHVLEEDRAFLLVGGFVVGAGEAGVEHVFDGQPDLGACRGLLAPVQDEQLLDACQ